MTVRQVATDYPACVAVFRRHGETDRESAKFGHLEPLDRFARRLGLPLDALLAELSQAAGVEIGRDHPVIAPAHRPFLAAAMAVTLSLGAGWGLLLLIEIGRGGSLTAAPASQVVAHGEAQLWGFIAPFIVGIAAAFLPRTAARPRPPRALLALLLGTLMAGVVGGFVWSLDARRMPWLGPASGLALFAAALGYFGFTVHQLAGKARAPWARSILASAVWMTVWGVVELVLRGSAGVEGPGVYSETARRLVVDLAVFGFAMNSVYGFGQKLLPGILSGGSPRAGAIEATFILHNLGVLALAASSFVQPRDLLAAIGTTAIAAGALAWAIGLRGFRDGRRSAPRPEAGPAFLARYVQLAFFWLVVGTAMLAAGRIAAVVGRFDLPPAYLGAMRHALTVGFLTTLILGVGQRIVPILSHDLLAWPGLVVPIFVCIAVGNALRVATELASLAWPIVFRVMPISAVFEITALGLFTANILRTLWPGRDPLIRTGRATPMTRVATLLAEHPWIEDPLVAEGVRYIGRVRSVPNELTVHSLAVGERMKPEALVARVNTLIAERSTPSGAA
jgi:hypothetical protein